MFFLNLEPPDRGPRNKDPKLFAAWLSVAIGMMLCTQRLNACAHKDLVSRLSARAEDGDACPHGIGHLVISGALVLAGLVGLVLFSPVDEAGQRQLAALPMLAACGGLGLYTWCQGLGLLLMLRREVQVGFFLVVTLIFWQQLVALSRRR